MRPCPACGGELRPWRTVPTSEPALGEVSFSLSRCAGCLSAVTDGEAPSNLYEQGAYRPGTPRLHALAKPILGAFDHQRLRILRGVAPPPQTLLDVGAGRGRFVRSAARAGYPARGVEPSQRGVQAAQLSGAAVISGDVDSLTGTHDVITLWHVLEHLDQPGRALAVLREHLNPGGVVLIGVPNIASWQARLGGARWYHLDVPRHRVHFTPLGLRTALTAAGFEVLATHHLLLEHNPFGMWQSLLNRATQRNSYLYNLLKRNAPLDARDLALTVAALPLLPVAVLLEAAAAAARRGGTIAVVARR